jgi:hypothetical protein
LPATVRGPVDFCELRRLDSILSWEDIGASALKVAGEGAETGADGGVGVGGKEVSGENNVGFAVNGFWARGLMGGVRAGGAGCAGLRRQERLAAKWHRRADCQAEAGS